MNGKNKILLTATTIIILSTAMWTIAAWDSPRNANPIVPGYFADPSMVYDSATGAFYLYATTDGEWISHSRQPHVLYSTDLVHWKSKPLDLPAFWPDTSVWAPSMMRHPKNGRY